MNIFVLHSDPLVAAQMMCDKHIPKMIVESAQMLSTAHRMLDGVLVTKPSVSGKRMVRYYDLFEGPYNDLEAEMTYYKAAHFHHPCTVWTMDSEDNYRWLWEHMRGLCKEYTYRFKTEKEPYKTHLTERKVLWPLQSVPRNIEKKGLTEFAQAMKKYPECMVPGNAVQAYQNYYHAAKPFAKWERGRAAPNWWKGYQGASLHTA